MNRFNKILFVADGSSTEKAALVKTIKMAKEIKARVSVIDTIDEVTEIFPMTEGTQGLFTLHKELVKIRKEELTKLVNSAKPRSLKTPVPVIV